MVGIFIRLFLLIIFLTNQSQAYVYVRVRVHTCTHAVKLLSLDAWITAPSLFLRSSVSFFSTALPVPPTHPSRFHEWIRERKTRVTRLASPRLAAPCASAYFGPDARPSTFVGGENYFGRGEAPFSVLFALFPTINPAVCPENGHRHAQRRHNFQSGDNIAKTREIGK